jgi:hypothetical protein
VIGGDAGPANTVSRGPPSYFHAHGRRFKKASFESPASCCGTRLLVGEWIVEVRPLVWHHIACDAGCCIGPLQLARAQPASTASASSGLAPVVTPHDPEPDPQPEGISLAFEDFWPPLYHEHLPSVRGGILEYQWVCGRCGFRMVAGDRVTHVPDQAWVHVTCPVLRTTPISPENALGRHRSQKIGYCVRCGTQIFRGQMVCEFEPGTILHWDCFAPLPRVPAAAASDRR